MSTQKSTVSDGAFLYGTHAASLLSEALLYAVHEQARNKVYTDETKAREDVAADFVGKLLADQATLESFCNAIERGKITKKTTSKIATFLRDTVNKLRGKTSVRERRKR